MINIDLATEMSVSFYGFHAGLRDEVAIKCETDAYPLSIEPSAAGKAIFDAVAFVQPGSLHRETGFAYFQDNEQSRDVIMEFIGRVMEAINEADKFGYEINSSTLGYGLKNIVEEMLVGKKSFETQLALGTISSNIAGAFGHAILRTVFGKDNILPGTDLTLDQAKFYLRDGYKLAMRDRQVASNTNSVNV